MLLRIPRFVSGTRLKKAGVTNMRHGFRAAARWIFPTLVFVSAGSSPPLLAQSDRTPAEPQTTNQAEAGAIFETIVPGASMVVTIPAKKPSEAESAPATPGAVFDAPNMPGVRMMAPIPDRLPATIETPAVTAPPTITLTAAKGGAAKRSAAKGTAAKAAAAKGAAAKTTAGGGARKSLLEQTVGAAKGGDWGRARRLAGETGNRTAATLVEWLYLTDRGSDASFAQVNAFLNAHANWPRRDTLLSRAEELMPGDIDPKSVIAWYGDREPLTASGMVRLGEALTVSGNSDKGVALIRKAWTEEPLSPLDEAAILQAHGDVLREIDHRARLEQRLALDDVAGATRQLVRVNSDARRVAEARLRLKSSPESVATVLAGLSGEVQTDRGLLEDAARAYRRRGRTEEALALMQRTPTVRGVATTPEQWWTDRHALAREALKDKRYQVAYDLTSRHGLSSGAGFADGEFLSGWIALRFLNKPDEALKHFQRLANGVSLPISVARAYYWSGRAEEALQHHNEAIAHYRRAARHAETFYGQLALARVEDSPTLRLAAASEVPSRADEAAFEADERVRAIRVLSEAGDRSLTRIFAVRIANDPPDAKKAHLLAQLMISLGDRAMAVRVAKLASYNGVLLLSHLAPVMSIPKFPGSAAGPDPALVLGVTRQESEFDPAAVSSSGARGLMQLMPATARRAATMNRQGFKLGDLTTNPHYNMQLGMVTLDDYLAYWGDSYVLGIASYNAGPSNVRKWVEANGDPRDGSVDPVDWIELIPFSETRNYVQRVLENIEVYRNRLSGSNQRLAILADLYRPKLPNRVVLKEQPSSPTDVPIPVQRPGATALQ
jgi:soluble lytic murein transglycosylase